MRSTSKPAVKTGKKRPARTVVGWREWVEFPDFGIERIKAKIDTGAKTSAIHAFRVRTVVKEGVEYAEFFLHPEQRRKQPEIFCRAPVVDRRAIKSSNGVVQNRLVIRTLLRMGEREYAIDLALANRDSMGFRLLLGRDSLRRKFAVDPSASYLLGK